MDSNVLLVKLDSRIDTSYSAEFEKQLMELLDRRSPGTLEKLPVFVRKLTLHSMRNSVKRLYFNKSDEVIAFWKELRLFSDIRLYK